jgi:hypothetical protein
VARPPDYAAKAPKRLHPESQELHYAPQRSNRVEQPPSYPAPLLKNDVERKVNGSVDHYVPQTRYRADLLSTSLDVDNFKTYLRAP